MGETVNKLKERLENLERRVELLERVLASEKAIVSHHSSKDLSLREFLSQKEPFTDVERTLAIGYYLEQSREVRSFNIDDPRKEFLTAKMKQPKNINDTVNLNVRKGTMMEAGGKKDNKKVWVLTDTGEKMVEKGFGKEEKN